MRHGISFAGTALSVVLVVLGLSIFTVDQRQHAIIFQLGEVKEVITEPGLYFKQEDMAVPEEYRGIGVRIEDDVLVTEDGCENLSAALPRRAEDVEAWIASIWQRPT